MSVDIPPEVFLRIVDLAAELTKNADHPSAAIAANDAHNVVHYRIKLFGNTLRGLYQAVQTADEAVDWK